MRRAARLLVKLLKQQPWTPHDLRPTAVASMAEARADADVRRRVTGHLATDVLGCVYERALRLEDMKAQLATIEPWVSTAAEADAAKGLKPGNVVRLKA